MASGGYHPSKQTKSDQKRRSNWQRSVSSERDDTQSLNSLPSDIRINNWDLADLRPLNLGDSKRRKKSKGNTEREREQSLSMDSPPRGEQKHHTSTSFPRTKMTPGTPTSQRMALENLKQHMTFSDLDDQYDGVDNERNNERHVSQSRSRLHNTSLKRADAETEANHINRNNNMDYSGREQGPDSNEIVARLMQIRDFMKQARSMLDSMEKMGERKKSEDVEKVRRLIMNLQEQEQGYKGLLQNTLKTEREVDGASIEGPEDTVFKVEAKEELDDSSVDLEVRTQNSETTEGSQENLSRPRIEDKLGLGSEDDDVEYSNSVQPMLEDCLVNDAGPSKVESREKKKETSRGGVQETQEGAAGGVAVDGRGASIEHMDLVRLLHEKQQQLQDLMQRQEELNLKRRETEKKLMDAQARDNKARSALAVVSTGRQALARKIKMDQDVEAAKEGAAGRWQREGGGDASVDDERDDVGEDGVLKSNIVGYPESDDDDNSNVREVDALPTDLLELKRQLNFLRNEFSQTREAPKNTEAEANPDLDDGRQQLQNKLQELQNKKFRMDQLLQELQMLHMQPLAQNNAQSSVLSKPAANIPPRPAPPRNTLPNLPTPASLPPSLQVRMSEVAAAAPDAVDSAMATFADLAARGGDDQGAEGIEPGTLEEVQEKLKRLKEVRMQLDQLRGLVTYYQDQKDQMENGGEDDDTLISVEGANLDTSSNPIMSQNVRKSPDLLQHQRQQQQERPQNQPLEGNDGDEHSDEDNVSVSQSDSQWSNLGPWDDDPEIQEKVRKLKAAKEKLRQLQDLVAFVQQSPDAGRALPSSLGDLASNMEGEGEAVSQATQTDEPNVSMSEGEVPTDEQQQHADEVAMENTRTELEQLRRERASLLDLQSQLKHLHAVVGRGSGEPEGSSETEGRGQISDRAKGDSDHAPNATVVTFASNDELYSKMRRQRILREELRSKKKELEAIMKKDRNKRQYSRNQDNQSDTVSLNTDTFGIPASVDATMATWGGSTVDNLENITEDEDGQGDDDEDEGDGYPSDGIVQVEEEEEENDTDNGTYTIEADARQRQKMRKPTTLGIGARPKTSRGKQTFPQPSYSDQTMKKPSQKQTRRTRTSQRESRIRQGNYRSAEELIQEDESEFKGKNTGWIRLMEGRLNNLSSSVESLMRKLDSNGRQLSVSLNQENTTTGSNLMSPMQDQMLQLHNQSMMLSFSHVVQSLARQQSDMQQLQQQMQNLQIQVHDVPHESGYQGLNNTAPAHALRPSLSASMLNNSSYNLQAAAPSLSVNAQNMSSPFAAGTLNNTAPPGFFGSFGHSPALPHLQAANPIPPPGNLGGLSVSTGSNLSLHQQAGVPSQLTFNPSNSAVVSHGSTSVSTMTRDFSQFVNTLQPTGPSSHVDNLDQFPSHFEPNQSSEDREEMEEARDLRMNAYKVDRKIKQGSRMKRSETNTSTGRLISTPKVENHKAEYRGRRGPIGQENSTEFSTMASMLSGADAGVPDETDFGNAHNGDSRFDASSSFSSIQSIRNEHTRLKEGKGHSRSTNTGDEENTLFDSLRDTIYTEVASLISQNENRPHFLLELFREMRQVDSDFLRQRTLYSLQDVLSATLTSKSSPLNQPNPVWLKATPNTLDTANSDQTPSESMTSEDDEDAHVALLQDNIAPSKRETGSRGQRQPYTFDYEETADNPSSLSTPSNYEESPFFQDALGETVIELDTLKRNASKQAGKPKLGEGAFLASEQLLRDMKEQLSERKTTRASGRGTHSGRDTGSGQAMSSVTVDQASESSMSDIPYPRIDMKQVDRQIKLVMKETIPIVTEHIDDVCSPQLLAYMKRLILSLTCQSASQGFDRYFQHQLSSILQDTLEKYEGRKISDCGEDLLVEISDVLFNELALFRILQDDPSIVNKMKQSPQSSPKKKSEEEEASDSSLSDNGDAGEDEELPSWVPKEKNGQKGFRITEAEQEEMGRERDDELANDTHICDAEEKDDDDEDYDNDVEEQSYKIELAPSETKPFTRIGSDEDDDNSDEEQSIEDPSETAVSRNNALMGTAGQQSVNSSVPPLRPETEGAWGDEEKEKQDVEKSVSPQKMVGKGVCDRDGTNGESQAPQLNGSVNGGPAHSDEEDEGDAITVDDLPERLTVGSSNDAAASATTLPAVNANTTELRQKYEAEKREVSGIQAVLLSLEELPELAGDGSGSLDPDFFLS